nr:hypothetical protein [uncultured Chryseobacterium sp.]
MDANSDFIPAVRLKNNPDGSSTYEKGKLPSLQSVTASSFWISRQTEDWEKDIHPAPRKQFVITLRGKIKFKVSDDSTFLIEPGIILLAEDTEGEGHSWTMEEGDLWERVYIPMEESSEALFVPDTV